MNLKYEASVKKYLNRFYGLNVHVRKTYVPLKLRVRVMPQT